MSLLFSERIWIKHTQKYPNNKTLLTFEKKWTCFIIHNNGTQSQCQMGERAILKGPAVKHNLPSELLCNNTGARCYHFVQNFTHLRSRGVLHCLVIDYFSTQSALSPTPPPRISYTHKKSIKIVNKIAHFSLQSCTHIINTHIEFFPPTCFFCNN